LGRPDQLCDHAAWGFQLCKRVNSPRVKMLFDIYHAQVQDGNVIATIRDNIQWIAHFHTAGVPGRHEIDDTQELNYHLVAQTIAELRFAGYVAHEYRPTPGRDPIKSIEPTWRFSTWQSQDRENVSSEERSTAGPRRGRGRDRRVEVGER
jgi:hydroxypyruvate isomerase